MNLNICIHLNFRQIGFYGVFSISASLYLIAFLYGLFIVKEPIQKTPEELEKVTKSNFCADFFDTKHVSDTFKVAFKKGANQRRLRVIMLMIVVMVVIGPLHGKLYEIRNSIANITSGNVTTSQLIFNLNLYLQKYS